MGTEYHHVASSTGAPVSLMGVEIDPLRPSELIDHLIDSSIRGIGGVVATVHLDGLRHAAEDPVFRQVLMAADFRVADGVPLLWASRLRGTPLPGRIAGADLIDALTEQLARNGRSVCLLGGAPGTAVAAASELRDRYPQLTVAATRCPENLADDAGTTAELIEAVKQDGPDFVYLGLPFSLALRLAQRMRGQLPSTWFLGLGVSFSFLSGEVQRAPQWMQRAGIEWIHRLAQEPRRLARRYLVDGIPFAGRLLGTSLAERLAGGPQS